MDALDLARWQFAITTVYHFLFVPVTIGLSGVVAFYHLMWIRSRKPDYLRLTKFFGVGHGDRAGVPVRDELE